MLDINFIRQNSEKVKNNCQKRGVRVDVDELLKIDDKRKKALRKLEEINARKNRAGRKIASLKKEKEKKKIISEMRGFDKESDKLKNELKKLGGKVQSLMIQLPNLCFEDTPWGKDEKSNVVLRKEGKKRKFAFKPKNYLEIARNFDLVDMKRAAKVSGSRFGYLKKEAVLLEFALVNLAFDLLTKEGFIPIIPPVLIKPEAMRAMGYIDTEEDRAERYFLEKDNLYLVGTAEQGVGPMHKDEIFEEKELPKRYAAFSTCFREEAGSYGKDTKGILRVHQFDKVEMFSFAKPEDSKKEHKYLLSLEEKLMKLLKIPYQVVRLCAGDLSKPSAATYDIESWMPGQNRYRETHSSSNCADFQARRLNIRYREKKSGKLKFVHTLNGTALAIGRTLIAIIENEQQKDGTVKVPKALQKYLQFKIIK